MRFVGMLAERVPFSGRLSRPADAAVVPRLRDRCRRGGARRQRRPADRAAHRRSGRLHGPRHCRMHYIGMATLRACAQMVNSAPLVVASAAVAIAASALALWLAFGGGSRDRCTVPVSPARIRQIKARLSDMRDAAE